MMSCSIAPAFLPQGAGQCGTIRPDADEGPALLIPAEGGQPFRFQS